MLNINKIKTETLIEDNEFKKPKNSTSIYRNFKLDNDLDVFLISNNKILDTSINLIVKVGSAMEGNEIDGLAHFLEHALFLGTEKYEGSNNFGKFVRTHGGITNALTDATMTYFSVTIPTTFLDETLKRFSEFFKKPLFMEDLLENEINIINSEFLSKSNNYYTLLEHVFKEIADKTHIYNKFFYGNIDTLKNIPECNGINIRDKLIEFYKNYYTSNNMILVIISNDNIKNLTTLCSKYFSEIKNNNNIYTNINNLSLNPEYPYNGIINKFIKINLCNDNNEMMIIFPIPIRKYNILNTFTKYISLFLSSDYDNGLLNDIIYKKKFCNKICVNNNYSQLGFSYITISIFLTNDGISEINDIIINIFSCIEMIKNTNIIDEYISKIKYDNYLNFNNIEENLQYIQIFDIIKSYCISDSLPNEFLYSYYKTEQFNQEIFEELINYMNIDKMFIVGIGIRFDINLLIKKNFINISNHSSYSEINEKQINKLFKNIKYNFRNRIEQNYILYEKYYRTQYSIWDLSNNIIKSIKSINIKTGIDYNKIQLSIKNILSLKINKYEYKELLEIKPPLLLDIALEFDKYKNNKDKLFEISNELKISNIWKGFFYLYIPSNIFNNSQFIFRCILPPLFGKKSFIKYGLKNLFIKNIHHLYILIDLLTECIKFKINIKTLLNNDLNFQIYPTLKSTYYNYSLGIELYIFGQINNLTKYLFEYSYAIKNISNINKIEFDIIKKNIINQQNYLYNQLNYKNIIDQIENKLINNSYIDNKSYIKILKNINYNEIIELSKFFQEYCFFEGIYAGNTNINILKGSLEYFINHLKGNEFNENEKPFIYVHDNPINDNYLKIYYKKIFFQQDSKSYIYKNSSINQNYFDLIDIFSIPPNKNKIYYLTENNNKNNILKLSIFFKRDDYITTFKLYIINQLFFDNLFEYIRQKKQIAYQFNTEINHIYDKFITYSLIIETENDVINTINTLLECLKEFSPKIITKELFELAIKERIQYILKIDSPLSFINEYIKLTNDRSFQYNWRENTINILKDLTYSQFYKWFSDSIKNPPILLIVIISNNHHFQIKRKIKKFVPYQFIKIKKLNDLFKFEKVKTFKFYHNTYN